MNDLTLAEHMVYEMRMAALREMAENTEVKQPTLEEVLKYSGQRTAAAPESTPNEDATIYDSTFSRGATDFQVCLSRFNRLSITSDLWSVSNRLGETFAVSRSTHSIDYNMVESRD